MKWIGPVYTPKEFRKKGYASALVASVSEKFLEMGKKPMLMTDLANPISNHIYMEIGFKPFFDVNIWVQKNKH